MKYVLIALTLFVPALAKEKLYTDAATAHIGPKALVKLHDLRRAGVCELLVPTWFPADLHNLRVKVAESEAGRFGPSLEMEWPSDNAHHSLKARGGSGGFGGPGPDYTIPVENPTVGRIDMWVCKKGEEIASLYCTDWLKVPGSMPTFPKDRCFYMGFDSVDKTPESLSADEMKRILASVRYFRLP